MVFSDRVMKEWAEMERQMGRLLRNTSLSRMVQMQSGSDWLPAVDVYETEGEIYVYVDTAGVDMNNLKVAVEENRVTISGQRQNPIRGNLCRIHQLEIEHGFFKRTISFPITVDVSATSTRYINGILEVRMAKNG